MGCVGRSFWTTHGQRAGTNKRLASRPPRARFRVPAVRVRSPPNLLRLRLLTLWALIAFLSFLTLLVIWGVVAGSNIALFSNRYDWLIRAMQLVGWLGIAGAIVFA